MGHLGKQLRAYAAQQAAAERECGSGRAALLSRCCQCSAKWGLVTAW